MGEVAERSEGRRGSVQTLSVACGDSSPKGRAKALCELGRAVEKIEILKKF